MGTRIVFGTLLTLLAVGVFYGDQVIGPPFPFLMVVTLLFGGVAAIELVRLIPLPRRPRLLLVLSGVVLVLLKHWNARHHDVEPWAGVVAWLAVITIFAFLSELQSFREAGESVNRVALTVLAVVYLGILAGFLVDLRLYQKDAVAGTCALVLTVFVPKGCDIGAYFTGSFIGKHKMTPVLSPKKTWEGAAGGLLTAIAVAVGVQAFHPIIPGGWLGVVGFGLSVGIVGMFGDLAESLIKRDCGVKDAARLIPSFGGVLDVIDAILFAAPVSYLWLAPTALQ